MLPVTPQCQFRGFIPKGTVVNNILRPFTHAMLGNLAFMFRGWTGPLRYISAVDVGLSTTDYNVCNVRGFHAWTPHYVGTCQDTGSSPTLDQFVSDIVGDQLDAKQLVQYQSAQLNRVVYSNPYEPRVSSTVPYNSSFNFMLCGADRSNYFADSWTLNDHMGTMIIGSTSPNGATTNNTHTVFMGAGDNFQFFQFIGIPQMYVNGRDYSVDPDTILKCEWPDIYVDNDGAAEAFSPIYPKATVQMQMNTEAAAEKKQEDAADATWTQIQDDRAREKTLLEQFREKQDTRKNKILDRCRMADCPGSLGEWTGNGPSHQSRWICKHCQSKLIRHIRTRTPEEMTEVAHDFNRDEYVRQIADDRRRFRDGFDALNFVEVLVSRNMDCGARVVWVENRNTGSSHEPSFVSELRLEHGTKWSITTHGVNRKLRESKRAAAKEMVEILAKRGEWEMKV